MIIAPATQTAMHEVESQPALSDLNQRFGRSLSSNQNARKYQRGLNDFETPTPEAAAAPVTSCRKTSFPSFSRKRKSCHERGRFRRKRVTYALASSDRRQTRGGLVPVSDTRACVWRCNSLERSADWEQGHKQSSVKYVLNDFGRRRLTLMLMMTMSIQ